MNLITTLQICKYFDIGSNKPSKEEMLEVPHHLVDFREPSDRFTAGDYVRTVDPIISGIISRGKLPVIVGGNTMWLDWLLHGV
jgi:tRNA dimethylallyltransferase